MKYSAALTNIVAGAVLAATLAPSTSIAGDEYHTNPCTNGYTIVTSQDVVAAYDAGKKEFSCIKFADTHTTFQRSFSGKDLSGIRLTNVSLPGVTFEEANLSGGYLQGDFGATTNDTSFHGANLSGATVKGNLNFADLSNTNLTGTNLIYSNLTHADLTDATVSYGTRLPAAMLCVKLTGIRGLRPQRERRNNPPKRIETALSGVTCPTGILVPRTLEDTVQ